VGERAWRHVSKAKAERDLVDQAAAWLRRAAIEDGYAGFRRGRVAFAMAAVLDMLALHWTDLPERLRGQVGSTCREVIRERDGIDREPPGR